MKTTCIWVATAVVAGMVACYCVLDYPLRKQYERYLSYVSMEELMKCEMGNVSRILLVEKLAKEELSL